MTTTRRKRRAATESTRPGAWVWSRVYLVGDADRFRELAWRHNEEDRARAAPGAGAGAVDAGRS